MSTNTSQNQNQPDRWAASNGRREWAALIGVVVSVAAVVGGLTYIFSVVAPFTLALIFVGTGALVYVAWRAGRASQRDHDAEVIHAGLEGMKTAMRVMQTVYGQHDQAQSFPRQAQRKAIGPPDDVWLDNPDTKSSRKVDPRTLPAEIEPDEVKLSNGVIPIDKLRAFVLQYPSITQDGFNDKGGGAPTGYKVFGDILCDCEPPLLLRKANDKRGGYVFAGQHWGAVAGWLRAHEVDVV